VKPNVVTIHLGRDDATGVIDPNAPVLIIAPDGSKPFGRLLQHFWFHLSCFENFRGAAKGAFLVLKGCKPGSRPEV
jgi:hypothetical protein